MKLTDKRFWKLEALSIFCGVLTCCICCIINIIEGDSWYNFWQLQLVVIVCWCFGTVLGWLMSKKGTCIPAKIYVWTNIIFDALALLSIFITNNISECYLSILVFYIFFIINLPALGLMLFIFNKFIKL